MANLTRRFDESFPGRPVVAIVNKIDLAPKMRETGGGVLFSSAKTGEGVEELFLTLGRAIWRRAG